MILVYNVNYPTKIIATIVIIITIIIITKLAITIIIMKEQ